MKSQKKFKLNPLDLKFAGNNLFATFRNNFIQKDKKVKTHNSINFSNDANNNFNNYFAINSIGNNNNYDNEYFYKTNIRKYHAFPIINYKRNEFIYK